MNYLRKNPNATQMEVVKAIGTSRRIVQDAISTLKEKGLLERDGSRKNGRWVVKDTIFPKTDEFIDDKCCANELGEKSKICGENKAPYNAQITRNENEDHCTLTEIEIMNYLRKNPSATQMEVADAIGTSRRIVQDAVSALKQKGFICREGSRKSGRWIVKP